jgi:hypothetical protein
MRAMFYNATGRTIAGLAGSIFQKAPSVELPEQYQAHLADITLAGETLEMFALRCTMEHLTTGRFGILVDMASDKEGATEERPYWVGYVAEDIINWRFKRMGGDQELDFVVLRELAFLENPEDEFSPIYYTRYRVLRLSKTTDSPEDEIYTQQIYEPEDKKKTDENKFIPGPVLIPTRRGKPLNFIPFSLPFRIGNPPLMDLVEVNLSHYRGSADLKHGLHYTALPTPWVAGATGDKSKPLHIGSGVAWSLEKDGQAGMLEFTGKGLGAIRNDLQDMQKIMATLGARLLEEPPKYTETATAVSMRHSGDYATLRTLGQVVEQQLTFALQTHIWWLGTEKLTTDIEASVELNKIFYDQTLTADEIRALLIALQSNAISYNTFYARLANAGWMREGVKADEELVDIERQPSKIGIAPVATAQKLGEGEKLAPT